MSSVEARGLLFELLLGGVLMNRLLYTYLKIMPEEKPKGDLSSPYVIELSKAGFHALGANDPVAAEKSFREMLEIEPGNSYALVGLAECAKKKSDPEAAIGWYQRCLELYPENDVSLRGLIMCYAQLSRRKQLIELWEKHREILITGDSMALKAADAYRKMREYAKAADLYGHLLAKNNANRYALSGLAHLQYEEEQYREAIKNWQKFLSLDGRNVIALTSVGNCYRRIHEFENGLEYYEKAADLDPSNFYALFGLADCCRGLHRYGESLDFWKRILVFDPANRMILTRAGEACVSLGMEGAAKAYFEEALEIGEDLYALVGMARLSRSRNETEQASTFYRRAARLPGAEKRFGEELASIP